VNLLTVKRGSHDRDLVQRVQAFLRGAGLYLGTIDGDFGPHTEGAVRDWQRLRGLTPDGIVGNTTWGSMMAAGLALLPSATPATETGSPNWPPRPTLLRPLSSAERSRLFGSFDYEPDPMPNNPEAIRITKRSPDFQLVDVPLPELLGVPGFPRSGRVQFEDTVAHQLRTLVTAWRKAGLLDRIISWAGTYSPRFVRGSRTSLSNHAWATAFDVNVAQNGLGARPALVGERGCVRELVPLANEHGFYWGGHFTRPDGMHFEACRVIPRRD
jgi:hypothetical protein